MRFKVSIQPLPEPLPQKWQAPAMPALTRRGFNQNLLVLALASVVPRPALALADPQTDLWLNRLTFGANPALRAEFAQSGLKTWLDAQLAMAAGDPELDQRLAAARLLIRYPAGDDGPGRDWKGRDEMVPLGFLTSDPAEAVGLLDFDNLMDYGERIRPAHEVINASMIRAVHAPAQLRELMTQFWHDHFNVNATKNEMTAAFFPSHDALLRTHAFGNFRALLGEVARSPAMLYYLNNDDSRASPANENFARELLELHTLGAGNYISGTATGWQDVPGAQDGLALAYSDQDVYEVARAFTGWSVGDGRAISEGVNAPQSGRFQYVEAWHDPYQKRVLAVEFAANRAPMADGDQVLDMLANHPGTAQFICRKLIRRLLADDPDPAMVDRVATLFLAQSAAPDQIAQVIRAVVTEPAFAATPPHKLRRPFEFLAALYRATGAGMVIPENGFAYQLGLAGWQQHEYGPPTGHPDRTDRWASATTLNRMVDAALYAHEQWYGCTDQPLYDRLAKATDTLAGLALPWTTAMLGQTGGQAAVQALADALGIADLHQPLGLTADERQGICAAAIAYAALTPQFLLR